MDIEHHRIPPQTCWKCRAVISAASSITHKNGPMAGGLSVCKECGTISKFDDNLILIPVPNDELFSICVNYPDTWNLIMKMKLALDEIRK